MILLDKLARLCALLAGLLFTAIALMTCASVAGRNFLGATLAGDFELTGVATGIAIALFMPWCQLRRGNICVDFFTRNLRQGTINYMDRTGSLLMAGFIALLAWHTALGGLNAWHTQSGSMLLGFPDWVVYAGMAPPLALTAVVALGQSFTERTAWRP